MSLKQKKRRVKTGLLCFLNERQKSIYFSNYLTLGKSCAVHTSNSLSGSLSSAYDYVENSLHLKSNLATCLLSTSSHSPIILFPLIANFPARTIYDYFFNNHSSITIHYTILQTSTHLSIIYLSIYPPIQQIVICARHGSRHKEQNKVSTIMGLIFL